jgi:hypothetical protein
VIINERNCPHACDIYLNYGRPKNKKYSPSAIIATTPIIVINTFNVNAYIN